MALADMVAVDSVLNFMLLVFVGFIIALIALVAYFLLKRAKTKRAKAEKRTSGKETAKNARG